MSAYNSMQMSNLMKYFDVLFALLQLCGKRYTKFEFDVRYFQ